VSRRLRRPLGLLVVLAVGVVLGWAGSVAWSTTAQLRLVTELAGTVTVVNQSGGAFCFEPDGGGQRCGVAYQRRTDPPLALGDRVSIAIGVLRIGPQTWQEIFVITAVQ
jgi:hypothetical protein